MSERKRKKKFFFKKNLNKIKHLEPPKGGPRIALGWPGLAHPAYNGGLRI
jgi:hypothetical protein